MHILVTGGAGFIGSHTSVGLLNSGYDVVIADNLSNSKLDMIDRIEEITGKKPTFFHTDLRDKDGMLRIFNRCPIEAVIHFAGYKAVPESVREPLMYYENNLASTFTLLEVMKSAGCKKIVFSSSATVYGPNNPSPYLESMPLSATNPYGWTKVMIEQILTDLSVSDPEWSIGLLRYFNPIGAHESGLIGEDPNGIPNNLLPYVSQVAAGVREELVIYGDDYATPDGTGERDYIHVVDLALGHIAALEYLKKHTGVEAVNLGTGTGTSVMQIVKSYEKACGRSLPYKIGPRRPGDLDAYYADTNKARRLLGWEATRSIDQMCADSWNFAKSRYGK